MPGAGISQADVTVSAMDTSVILYASSIKSLLVDQIVKPVRWEQTMQTLVGQGDARWIELAPGRTLTGMLKKINRRLPVESLESAGALGAKG